MSRTCSEEPVFFPQVLPWGWVNTIQAQLMSSRLLASPRTTRRPSQASTRSAPKFQKPPWCCLSVAATRSGSTWLWTTAPLTTRPCPTRSPLVEEPHRYSRFRRLTKLASNSYGNQRTRIKDVACRIVLVRVELRGCTLRCASAHIRSSCVSGGLSRSRTAKPDGHAARNKRPPHTRERRTTKTARPEATPTGRGNGTARREPTRPEKVRP